NQLTNWGGTTLAYDAARNLTNVGTTAPACSRSRLAHARVSLESGSRSGPTTGQRLRAATGAGGLLGHLLHLFCHFLGRRLGNVGSDHPRVSFGIDDSANALVEGRGLCA